MSTIFSKIIRGEADADIVYQDDRVPGESNRFGDVYNPATTRRTSWALA